MNVICLVLFGASVVVAPSIAMAQFIKGNEAVQVLPDGSKKVETPPTAGALLAKPCPAAQPACSGGGWKMVETVNGMQECTEVYARSGTCQPSTYGKEKRARVWVVKSGSQWLHCPLPEMGKGCVSIKTLPTPAVQ